jgi:hypothetical protein
MSIASVLLMKPFYGGNGKVACDWLVKWVDEGVGGLWMGVGYGLGRYWERSGERLGSK